MTWLAKAMQRLGMSRRPSPSTLFEPDHGMLQPTTQDTWAAIDELSQVVKNNPEAVEIYLALGNLFRSQGEIERAVQIRNSLIVRHGLDPALKARAWYQLGRDFRRGGLLDRALSAFEQARNLAGDKPSILLEMARLAADSGEFETAADYYQTLGRPLEQAHYLVMQARELRKNDESSAPAKGRKLIQRALKAYPGSVEAWIELVVHVFLGGDEQEFSSMISEALDRVEPRLRFLLLEGLIQVCPPREQADWPPVEAPDASALGDHHRMLLSAVDAIETCEPDVVLMFYAAWMLLLCGLESQARVWLEKCLMLQHDFWLARVELFSLARREQALTPSFNTQLDYFIDRARGLKRFVCSACGLKRESIFFLCPKCSTWHSIVFRTTWTP
ncbi:MAG: tetratricopeptide repeat protein [Desulfovibrionaceae bacterium]